MTITRIEMQQAGPSSTIDAVGHDAATSTLQVAFKSGQVYRYQGVPADIFTDFLNADSPGKFHASAIKGQFDHERVDEDA